MKIPVGIPGTMLECFFISYLELSKGTNKTIIIIKETITYFLWFLSES